jgi:hypothetical protein
MRFCSLNKMQFTEFHPAAEITIPVVIILIIVITVLPAK